MFLKSSRNSYNRVFLNSTNKSKNFKTTLSEFNSERVWLLYDIKNQMVPPPPTNQ